MKRILFGHPLSGNTHRVRLLLGMLNLPYEEIPVDIPAGEQKKPEYVAINPLGLVPVLIEGDQKIRDSHAILTYLARAYGGEQWLPSNPFQQATVAQWLSFSANEIHNSANLARLHFLLGVPVDLPVVQDRARSALHVVNQHLADREWLELDRPTIADLACFPYLGLVEEGKVSRAAYPNVNRWIDRIKALPGYVSMPGL
ncbi:glutathione S-transferase family protein [Leptolyngbya sp. NK1-12]|uniref:Glutathione S-transferase family protein n=1 Tax=Leptolyngbya sp. NK1-12 TaxID=2547451 RepID=A0AA96WV83_9CYAN|nr:glutathione S-transferase family protein [Leptolyngbya sp. NK1-12]WNZ24147.1 glutathione S-transferase family protein [Leptolyngbya sp. NK1-12]